MDKKDVFIIGLLIAVALFVITFLYFSGAETEESFIDGIFKGGKEEGLNNYIQERRQTQTKYQRDSTISLFVSALSTGRDNTAKILTPSEAPKICDKAEEVVSSGSTEKEKAEKLADYLSTEIEYDWGNIVMDATGKPRTRTKKDPREVLESGAAICGEMSNTYMLMADCVGIEAYYIYGGGHAWSVVKIGMDFYEVDTTQDCFDCDISEPEHSYPIIGLCDLSKCITMSQVSNLVSNQKNIFEQTTGK